MKSSLRSTHSVISAESAGPLQSRQNDDAVCAPVNQPRRSVLEARRCRDLLTGVTAVFGVFIGKVNDSRPAKEGKPQIGRGILNTQHAHVIGATYLNRTQVRFQRSTPLGFTLMETLVALGLLVAIMSSLSSGIHLYWKYRRLSQDSMTASKLTRGIIEDLTCDLRAVSPPQYLSAEVVDAKRAAVRSSRFSGPASSIRMEKALNITESTLSLSVSESTPVHFYGTERVLAMYTENESVRFVKSSSHPSGITKRHLIWKLGGGGSVTLPLTQIGPRQVEVRVRRSETERGLIRISRSFESNDAVESLSEEQTLISEGVESLTFRYFDGNDWFGEWNSTARIGLPAAVEVKIRMRDRNEDLVSVIRLLSWQANPLVRKE